MGALPKNKITRVERGKRRAGNTPTLVKDSNSKIPLHKRGLVASLFRFMGMSAAPADKTAKVAPAKTAPAKKAEVKAEKTVKTAKKSVRATAAKVTSAAKPSVAPAKTGKAKSGTISRRSGTK